MRRRFNQYMMPGNVHLPGDIRDGYPQGPLKKMTATAHVLLINRAKVSLARRFNCRTNWSKVRNTKADIIEAKNLGYRL